MTEDLKSLLAVAVEAANAAAAILIEKFSDPTVRSTAKGGPTDLVSEADRTAEQAIEEVLRRRRPADGIFGEESGESAGTSRLRWIVDPLDGTENYLRELTPWATSIACEDGQNTLVGVVADPVRREIFAAQRNAGLSAPGERQHAKGSAPRRLDEAVLATGRLATPASMATVFDSVGKLRNFGCVALSLAWTAAGRCDICYFESERLSRWDAAAGTLLCIEAGLTVQWLGPLEAGAPPRLVAGPGHLVQALAAATS